MAYSEQVIEFLHVTKLYARAAQPALRDVHVVVHPGESVSIHGPKGSGKSTMLRLLMGVELPSFGQVWALGRHVAMLGTEDLRRLRRAFGCVFQDLQLIGNMTVLDNVMLPLKIAGDRFDAARQRALQTLERLDMGACADEKCAAISLSEQQRAAIARAFVGKPPILILDEPMSYLQYSHVVEVAALIKEAHTRGAIVILLTRSAPLDESLGQKRFLIEKGHLISGTSRPASAS